MDFKDQLKQIAEKINKFKESTQTEEATKNAFVMPFIGALGYDIFNPEEVVPEFTADIGVKVGEKVDYAILKDGSPVILIECKHWKDDLNIHNTQLLRYFNVTTTKFAILTNGIYYRFYTDLESTNIMDEKPFLDINILEIKDNQIEELKKFHKSYFDLHNIITTASTLKYSNEIKIILNEEFKQPSEDFVKFFVYKVYTGKATERIINQWTEIVKVSCQQFLSDLITDRLKTALDKEKETQPKIEPESKKTLLETTGEELDGYYIVKSIIRQVIDSRRIYYRDFQYFFSILIDDSQRNTICRLYLTETEKQIAFLDEGKNESRFPLKSIDDIFKFSEQLKEAANKYVKQ
jgi:hypothetical protein